MGLAVIFDMDGVIVDSVPFHIEAWQTFLKKHNLHITDEEFKKVNGMTNDEIFRELFDRELSQEEVETFKQEKEQIYRDLYRGHVTPTKGLPEFITELKNKNIPIAIATAGTPENVELILEETGLEGFDAIVDATQVKKGKPHPDIFLTAAKALHANPKDCVVFEDAIHGVESAKRADMLVIALATTHEHGELDAHLSIHDFTEINIEKIESLKHS